ncbi:hypothetical protein [Largemouth bass virus]|nr:hypothetical protein OA88_22795 [Flavobacterium sp. JRM]WEI28969.1 hypothetical protein [Largemouth bass virus]
MLKMTRFFAACQETVPPRSRAWFFFGRLVRDEGGLSVVQRGASTVVMLPAGKEFIVPEAISKHCVRRFLREVYKQFTFAKFIVYVCASAAVSPKHFH